MRWATALGLILKLGLIPKIFKALIEMPQYIYIYKKIKKAHVFKQAFKLNLIIIYFYNQSMYENMVFILCEEANFNKL